MYKNFTTKVICGKENNLFHKLFRAMKFTILLLVTFFQVNAATYAQKINLKKNNAPLLEILNDLRKQSRYNIFYNEENVKAAGLVSVNISNLSIEAALHTCLQGKGLDFKIVAKNIIISPEKVPESKSIIKEITVTGTVTTEQNEGLPGVSVSIKGTKHYVITDNKGMYKIAVPNEDAVLVFSYLGYGTVEKKLGKKATLNVVLKEQDRKLNEVVVTALGIKREEKALGYAVTTIKGADLTSALSNNWTDALSGKVAGLNLIKSGGGPGSSNRIILRGESSLSGDTEALIVVDGVVINSSSGKLTGTGNSAYGGEDSPIDYGSSLSDINPEDIENVTVLKGPGASALYGSRGANGAIIITTKSGNSRKKGIGITVTSNSSIEGISHWPDYQYEYGQGTEGSDYYSYYNTVDGANKRGSFAWGPKFDGQVFFQYDPATNVVGEERTPWVPYKNNHKDFFETGQTYTNSITLDGGNDKTTARFSFTNLTNSWIIPNTGYNRNTVALSLTNKITPKLQISAKVNYTNKYSDNLPAIGYNSQSIMKFMMVLAPSTDMNWFRQYWSPGQDGVVQNPLFVATTDNPYLIANEMLNKINRNSVTGNVQANYAFSKNLNLMVRTTMDFAYDARSQQRPFDTEQFKQGMYRTQNIFSQELNYDFLLRYNTAFSKKFEMNASLGGSRLRNKYVRDELRANSLLYPDIFNFANSRSTVLTYPFRSSYGTSGIYALASLTYDKFIYLDLTARNDWTSTLATPESTENVSFFYPSASLSAVLSDKLRLPEAISFLKLRASLSRTGSGTTTPYMTAYGYVSQPFPSGQSNPTTIANPDLKALSTTSIELGADMRFFKNRIGVDVAVYKSNTKDQILAVPIDQSTGYSYAMLNSGEVENRGIELSVNGTPFKSKRGLTWTITGTFSSNRNKVLSLADSIETLVLQKGGPGGTVEARPGYSMGEIYGQGYVRSPDGQIVYSEQGYPILDVESKRLGTTIPAWQGSIGNQFSYKQFRLNVLFDGSFGAKAYSLTNSRGGSWGTLSSTLPGRYNGIIGDGVVQNPDGTYRKNDIVAETITTYYTEHYKGANVEGNLFSTDYIKLREVRLDYTLPSKMLKRLSLQKATIGLYGRDLFMITNWPAFDPEFGTLNGSDITRGFEMGQFPSTRTIGLNVTVGF